MKKICVSVLNVLCLTLIFTVSDCSLLFAEIYQWTDANGTIHFSDSPANLPKGKKPLVRMDDTSNIPPSTPLRSRSRIAPQKNVQERHARERAEKAIEDHKPDPETVVTLQRIWRTMANAIVRGDIETAVQQFVPGMQDRYRAWMNDSPQEAVARIKEIIRLEVYTVTDDMAQAGALRKEPDGIFAYPVNFAKGSNGWKIYGF